MPRSNQWRRTLYRERIEKLAPGYDPAHVEAHMMHFHTVIDALSSERFGCAVVNARLDIDRMGLEWADEIALDMGLRPKKRAS